MIEVTFSLSMVVQMSSFSVESRNTTFPRVITVPIKPLLNVKSWPTGREQVNVLNALLPGLGAVFNAVDQAVVRAGTIFGAPVVPRSAPCGPPARVGPPLCKAGQIVPVHFASSISLSRLLKGFDPLGPAR